MCRPTLKGPMGTAHGADDAELGLGAHRGLWAMLGVNNKTLPICIQINVPKSGQPGGPNLEA